MRTHTSFWKNLKKVDQRREMKLAVDHPYRDQILAERRDDRMAARTFEQACTGDSGEALHEAADLLNRSSSGDAWRLAMIKVAGISSWTRADTAHT